MKIKSKILFVLLSITIPSITFIGIVSYTIASDEITTQILEELDAISSIQKQRILESIDRNYERLHIISSNSLLQNYVNDFYQSKNQINKQQITQILIDSRNSIDDIQEVHILDENGIILFSSEPVYVNQNYLSSPMYQDAHYEKTIGVTLEEYEGYVLYVSGPLRLENKFLGILAIEVTTDVLNSISTDYTGLGDTGETIIASKNIDGDAQFITSLRFPDSSHDLIVPRDNLHDPTTHALLQHQTIFSDSEDYRGEKVLASTRYIEPTGWGLITKIDSSEALSSIMTMQFLTFFGIGIVATVSIIVSVIISNSMASPIRKLSKVASEISEGNLSTKVSVSGSDEISQLAKDIYKMEQSLESAQKEIIKSERFSAIGELASKIAHDLRSPLTAIDLVADMWIMKHPDMSKEDLERINMIKKSTSKITYLVENILDFVRTKDPLLEDTSLLGILNSIKKSSSKPEKITITLPSDDMIVSCDPRQMDVVLENLISNAVQAIDYEGDVSVRFSEDEGNHIIEIQDSGKGISPTNLEHIFEPLFTTKITGTGLGLASCKSIIETHNGTLTVTNNPTIFKITLPKNSKNS